MVDVTVGTVDRVAEQRTAENTELEAALSPPQFGPLAGGTHLTQADPIEPEPFTIAQKVLRAFVNNTADADFITSNELKFWTTVEQTLTEAKDYSPTIDKYSKGIAVTRDHCIGAAKEYLEREPTSAAAYLAAATCSFICSGVGLTLAYAMGPEMMGGISAIAGFILSIPAFLVTSSAVQSRIDSVSSILYGEALFEKRATEDKENPTPEGYARNIIRAIFENLNTDYGTKLFKGCVEDVIEVVRKRIEEVSSKGVIPFPKEI